MPGPIAAALSALTAAATPPAPASTAALGDSGFGFAQSVVPSASGDKISLKLLTPFFDIPLYSFNRPVKDRVAVDFYDPFVGP
jgi:hypothetical protein